MTESGAPLRDELPSALAHEGARATDWVVRLYEAVPLPPVAFGGVLAGLNFVWSVSTRTAVADVTAMWVAVDALNATLFAFVPTAIVLLRRAVVRDLVALRPLIARETGPFESLVDRVLAVPPRWLVVGGLLLGAGIRLDAALRPGLLGWR